MARRPSSSADQFTYVAAPTVTSVSPSGGPSGGGTSVILTGTGFSGATAVKFGTTNATIYTVNSATQITATDPAGNWCRGCHQPPRQVARRPPRARISSPTAISPMSPASVRPPARRAAAPAWSSPAALSPEQRPCFWQPAPLQALP